MFLVLVKKLVANGQKASHINALRPAPARPGMPPVPAHKPVYLYAHASLHKARGSLFEIRNNFSHWAVKLLDTTCSFLYLCCFALRAGLPWAWVPPPLSVSPSISLLLLLRLQPSSSSTGYATPGGVAEANLQPKCPGFLAGMVRRSPDRCTERPYSPSDFTPSGAPFLSRLQPLSLSLSVYCFSFLPLCPRVAHPHTLARNSILARSILRF